MGDWLELLAGGLLLYFGAEWFVGGAASMALFLRVPKLIVGLTVVAYGTSAPELVVSVEASLDGRGGVALGNIIGSNIANIGLILGLSALVKPADVHGSLRTREVPALLASAALLPLMLLDGVVSRWEGIGLMACAAAYTAWMARSARSPTGVAEAQSETSMAAEATEAAGAPTVKTRTGAFLSAAVGLGVLLAGGRLFVEAAVALSLSWGVSERLVGLTVVAVGTSLPELVTSVIAAARGHGDIAVGNVVGSNIFNVLLCLGAAATAHAIVSPLAESRSDLIMLAIITVYAVWMIRTQRVVSRLEGLAALAMYVGFMTYLVLTQ